MGASEFLEKKKQKQKKKNNMFSTDGSWGYSVPSFLMESSINFPAATWNFPAEVTNPKISNYLTSDSQSQAKRFYNIRIKIKPMTVAANRTKKETPTRTSSSWNYQHPFVVHKEKQTMMITNNPEKKHKTMGTSTMRFHSQALDLHKCNTKKQEKKLQPKRTHLLRNTQKPTNLNNSNWELGSSSKLNYFQKYLLLLTQYNNHNCKNTHKFWLILDSFLLTIFGHSLTRSKLSLSLSLDHPSTILLPVE